MENKVKVPGYVSIPVYVSLFIMLLIGAAAIKSCFTKPTVFSNIERIREIRDDSISYWRDAYNREHAEKKIAQADLATAKVVYGPLIDSVLNSLNIMGKQVENLTVAGLQSSNHIPLKVDTIYIDSSTGYKFSYNDRWIQLAGMIGKSPYLNYTTYDSLIFTSYYKKSGFLGLGKKTAYIDAYSINPNSRITGLHGIQIVTEKPKKFGIGPYIGYGWNGNQFSPSIGIGLNYSIIKF